MGSYVLGSPSLRDQVEMRLCADAIEKNIPILGVCRGAQLLCALAGGILVQDVGGHEQGHRISTPNVPDMMSSSLHHQMMYPWKTEHELLGWSSMPRSTHYHGITDEEAEAWPTREYTSATSETTEGFIEPEIVWFPAIKGLAIQGHPEMMDAKCPLNLHLKTLLNSYCFHS
jgi:putative glutamine amidotransferase